ncbi:MAG: hypothetical protein ACYTGX_10020 [Planctomycetota bacterium]|jgi:hypothetical protein
MRTMIWGAAAAASLLVAAAPPPAAGQEQAAEAITFVCDWKVGEKRTFTRAKRAQDLRGGTPVTDRTTTTEFTVEVLSKTEDGGHTIAWTWGDTTLETTVPVTPMMRKFANLIKGVRIEMELDATGGILKVLNEEAVYQQVQKAIQPLKEALEGMGLAPDVLKQTLATLGSKETVAATSVGECRIFFMGSGGQMEKGKELWYEDALPNPYGGDPFPAKARFLLTRAEKERNELHIDWFQELEPKKTVAILKQVLSKRYGREITDAELPNYSINDRANFSVEWDTAWPKRVTHSRTVTSGTVGKKTELTFTFKSKEAAGK